MNGLFSSCLWKNSGTRCFLLLTFFFFISNVTAICKNKIPPFSESEMISKELQSLHFSSFSVIKQIFWKLSPNIVGKLSPNIVKNYYLSPSGNPLPCWDFLMFDQNFLLIKFFYLEHFFTWKLEFVSNILWMIEAYRSIAKGVYKLRALFISPLTHCIFLFTQKI